MVRRSQDEERDNNNDLLIGVAGAVAFFGAYWLFSGKSEEKPKTSMEEAHYATAQGRLFDVSHGEEKLKILVKRDIRHILQVPGIPTLIAEEWPAPADHIGKGDLVYHYNNVDYVVELKWIDYDGLNDYARNSQTIRTRNRQKRNDVKKQAENYGKKWLQKNRPYNVVALEIINDEYGVPMEEARIHLSQPSEVQKNQLL